jgi:FHA domain
MQPEVTLTISDESGQTRHVVVQSKRFTIGRTPDNDLAIPNSNLSRRHAVIEAFGGMVQIADCGSQNGTQVNGTDVAAGAVLHDGDLITLGGVCDIMVAIGGNGEPARQSLAETASAPSPARLASRPQAPAVRTKARAATVARASSLEGLGVPIIVTTAVAMVILIAGGLLIFLPTSDRRQRNRTDGSQVNRSDNQVISDQANTGDSTVPVDGESNVNSKEVSAGAEQVEKAATAVMRRISSDDKTYSFSDKALQDIGRKVVAYRGSTSLASNLQSIQRSSSTLGALATQEGLEPGLLIYAVLALTDTGRTNADPVALARGIISNLLALRATFGTNDADGSLIIIAAYKMGGGGKRSHPLLVTIRRLVRNPLTQRNVWYLNERGGLDAEVYDFVLTFLALAVIAQEPGQFGVAASPLVF